MPSTVTPPKPPREFRGAWLATVANLDWPSRPGLSTSEQKAELVALLDRARLLNLNVVIFQVRPACDALYLSALEPWSEYLTGTMGVAPKPFYDPLGFAVEEAHKRGLELHAWFNPYRARHFLAKSAAAANHVSRTHPQWVRAYGKELWMDPGDKEVQDYSLAVVMDVLRRYDIDGVHFDDYFYPYQEKDSAGRELPFPDDATWRRFGPGTQLSRDDWRRENVNQFIRRVYDSIRATKPWVKFGVSPFGIWRPGNPPQVKGYDAYARLYADSRKWLTNGWVDYFAPQLYWSIDSAEQSFPILLKWWASQNPQQRVLVPGLDATKTNGKWPIQEIVNQIRLARQHGNVNGQLLWDLRTLAQNGSLAAALQRECYPQLALVPTLPGHGAQTLSQPGLRVEYGAPALPGKPAASQTASSLKVRWQSATTVSSWFLQTRTHGAWTSELFPGTRTSRTWTITLPDVISVTAIDRYGKLSPAAVLERHR